MADPLFDERGRLQRRARALRRDPRPFLAERIARDWAERLAILARKPGRGLATGVPPALEEHLAGAAGTMRFASSFDALAEEEEGSLDLLLVMGELDARDDLPLLLRIARSRVAPGGLLMGALPGGQSLPALRRALHAADEGSGFAARSHPRIEPGALAALLGAAGFVDPICDIDRVRLRYSSLARLVGDLRDHGATSSLRARPRRGLTRAARAAAEAAFPPGTEETVEIIHYAGWARAI